MYDIFIFGAVFSDLTWLGLSIVAFGMGFNIYKMLEEQNKNKKMVHPKIPSLDKI